MTSTRLCRLVSLGPILGLVSLMGCDRGNLAGVGVACGPDDPCLSFLACVEGRCEARPPDAGGVSSEAGPSPDDAAGDEGKGVSDGLDDEARDAPPDGEDGAADAPGFRSRTGPTRR